MAMSTIPLTYVPGAGADGTPVVSGLPANFMGYMAAAAGGPIDLMVLGNTIAMVPHKAYTAFTLLAVGELEPWENNPDVFGRLESGYNFDGPGAVLLAYARVVCTDTFESYNPGPVGALDAGTGWDGAAAFLAGYVGLYGVDTFESYNPGPVGALDAGTGWDGAGAVLAYS